MAHEIGSLLVIGGGAMATAILEGAAAQGRLPRAVCVVEPDEPRRGRFETAVANAAEGIAWLDAQSDSPGPKTVMLAVKPQMLGAVADDLPPGGAGGALVVSILAGTKGERIAEAMGGACRVVRVMPNTPAQIGRGVTAVAASSGATRDDVTAVQNLFAGVGDVVVSLDESLMDGFTAIAGSGPAYLFYLAEAMEAAASSVGLPGEHAREVIAETLAGAAELLRRSGKPPAELRAAVTSKRGTTQAATDVFDDRELSAIVLAAITAARDRGQELSTE